MSTSHSKKTLLKRTAKQEKELAVKSYGLKIESALEKVSIAAMSMRRSKDLSGIGTLIFKELKKLGFTDLRNSEIIINNDAKETITSYYYSDYGVAGVIELDHKSNAIVKGWADQLKKASNAFAEVVIPEKEMKAWRKYREEIGYLPDRKLNKAKTVYYYSYSTGHGALSISSFKPVSKEQIKILKRFRNVFQLSYQRYIDIAKAEAQTREAQIEAALERVRASSMAMHRSDELDKVIKEVTEQLTVLGFDFDASNITTDLTSEGLYVWNASPAQPIPSGVYIPYKDIYLINWLYSDWGIHEGVKTDTFNKAQKNAFFKHYFAHTDARNISDVRKKYILDAKSLNLTFACRKDFALGILNYRGITYTEEENNILNRFSKVFGQSYTRFLDLQKAEAQAREAQIEAGLERVRSHAMAMRSSEELNALIGTVFTELTKLDLVLTRCVILIYEGNEKGVRWWMANSEAPSVPMNFFVKYADIPFFNEYLKGWQERSLKWQYILEGENKFNTDEFLFKETELLQLPDFVIAGMRAADRVYLNASFNNFGNLTLASLEPLSDEHFDILLRFAKVFDLTYTRFNDLKQAEAQAREAQIEAALERVRARSMAMHHSSELHDAANVLFQQLRIFGGNIMNAGIALCTEDADEDEYWLSSNDGLRPVISIPHTEDAIQKKLYEDWKNKSEFFSIAKGGDELRAHYNYMQSVPHLKSFFEEGPDWSFPTWQKWHAAYFSRGYLFMITLEPYEEEKILVRFARVFEQAYTRFLDLKKAEAQAREAQIEAALERVRSKTMAMHNSQDVGETVVTMFDEVVKLGIHSIRCGIGIFGDTTRMELWTAKEGATSKAERVIGHLDMTRHPLLQGVYNTWKNKEKHYAYELAGNDLISYFNIINSDAEYPIQYELNSLPPKEFHNSFYFPEGVVYVFSSEELSEEAEKIFKRFAGVFGQTYRRYLDLQRAEAQAREAQVESVLEKVRSRSLAMHKSDELQEVVNTVFERLRELNVEMDSANIAIFKEGTRDYDYWIASPVQKRSAVFHMPYIDPGISKDLMDARETHTDVFLRTYSFEEKNEWFERSFQETDFKFLDEQRKKFILDAEGITVAVAFAKNTGVQINRYSSQSLAEPEIDILKRFSKVFEQAYIRFLDLQRAEAQAREAQIETALERVRSKAMAMHNSADLSSAASVVFTELKKLGIRTIRSGISLQNKENRKNLLYTSTSTDKEENLSLIGWAILDDHPVLKEIHDSWMRGEDYFPMLKGDELKSYYEKIKSTFTVPAAQSQDYEQHGYFMAFTQGMFYGWAEKPFDDNEKNTLKRFASVVDLTFKRYFDLQKAEGNAREAQIETSLERVRSKTMAMHNSNDVGETVAAMFAEFVHLGIQTNRCGILIFNDQYTAEVWTARSTPGGNAKLIVGKLDLDAHKMLRSVYNAWKGKETFYQYDLLDNDLVQYYTAINNSKFYPTQFDLDALPSKEFHSDFFFSDGAVFSFTNEPVIEEYAKIIKRFAGVFGQTYRRYLDLQKAEAQAREAQIEAGLERVRARTMAMHSSEDVSIATATMFTELEKLGVENFRGGFTNLLSNRTQDVWSVYNLAEGKVLKAVGAFDIDAHPFWQLMFKEWEAKKDFLDYFLAGQEKEEYIKILNATHGYLPQAIQQFPDVHFQVYYFNEGGVWTNSLQPHSEEDKQVMKRFASVFSLTFRRYQDLKKAEAQAKEAQIETSLERVRSKTMAMHSSDDVTSATATMFTELERLGVENMRCGIAHYLEDHKMEVWSVSNLADGKVVRGAGLLDTNSIPFWKIFYSTWQKKEDFLYYLMAGKEKEDYFKKISTLQNYLSQSIEEVPDLSIQTYYFPEGSVWAFSLKPHSEEDKQVMKRFASVFSLTFRRYQDLKRAEAQAREATIEAALEKVRGKAMAMHNSNDLSVTASLVFTELRKLGINPIRCGVGLLNKESRKGQLYSATASSDGDSLSLVGWVMLSEHPVLEKIYESWADNEEYYPELQGEQMRSYYQLLLRGLPVAAPKIEDDKKQFGTFLPFSVGCLYAWSEVPYDETEIKILKRFATIIDLTFRRYIELQTSETNARETVKQAALDRIRADIASMRTIADLDRITPLIWNELTILGLPFIRCGVFIMDSSQQLIHTFLSTPDGKAIGAFHLPYDTPGNFSVMLKHWLDKETYISRWSEVDFIGIAEVLVQQGSIATREQYLSSLPKDGFYLHFLPFLQGMLYVGNTRQLGEEEIELIQHVADAFSTAYARYEDFNKLEAAKQQVEKTLTDLKQAQTQLVQSEKMASLGELTAGIAHEIQNPLNFVNNFSDVSNELLDEMKEELAKGNIGDAIAIAEDVKQNLEKINHHGKRADGIVKGMLQHSRTSSGQKEMTDINSLADEYLRLAYHGLRAKEKSFNAKFETDFDKSIEKINIIPQEIGRVILNLINNAFYAVSEKKKQAANGYEPTVIITTVRDNSKIEVKVTDNGNGIPQKILDKVFQPFFTTKPTGQGTGLGLSLAYDIIKAHGGDIRVETKEGEGSEFIIQLPTSTQ